MLTIVMSQPPVTPSADEARQWAERELTKAIYNDDPTLLEQVLDWLTDLWDRLQDATGALGPVATPLVIVGVLVLILAVAFVLAGPVRRRRRRRGADSVAVLDGDERSALQIRAAADRAAAGGDYPLATLERYRAIVRSLDERAILVDRPGRTAHEAAAAAAPTFPDHAGELTSAAGVFDAVCYGHRAATRADYASMCDVDAGLTAARPVRNDAPLVSAP